MTVRFEHDNAIIENLYDYFVLDEPRVLTPASIHLLSSASEALRRHVLVSDGNYKKNDSNCRQKKHHGWFEHETLLASVQLNCQAIFVDAGQD